MRFKDRAVLISGGGSVGPSMSKGHASVIKFAREGALTAIVDLNLESAEEPVRKNQEEGTKPFPLRPMRQMKRTSSEWLKGTWRGMAG